VAVRLLARVDIDSVSAILAPDAEQQMRPRSAASVAGVLAQFEIPWGRRNARIIAAVDEVCIRARITANRQHGRGGWRDTWPTGT
jgi:hypothetical protein